MSALVIAATDGSAINNPHGPAGWAWFVSEDCWAAGGFSKASNQVAEMFAVLALLRAVPREHPLLVRTDSQFVINVMTKWMKGWKRPDGTWRKPDGTEPANLALLQDLDRASVGRIIRFEWVRGHAGDPMNEIADRICTAASAAIQSKAMVVSGPGWTGYTAAPVVPRVGAKAARPAQGQAAKGRQGVRPQGGLLSRYEPSAAAVARPVGSAPAAKPAADRPAASKPAPRAAAAPAKLVGERVTQADIDRQGYGANARVRRVTAKTPSSPERQKFEICKSCDGAIHPLTLQCRCGSM